jgi:hypothetical protein
MLVVRKKRAWVKENRPLDVDRGRPFTGDDHLLPYEMRFLMQPSLP